MPETPSPPTPPQTTMCLHGRGQRTCTRPTLRASRVNIRSRSQRMRTTGVNQLYSKRWQLHDGDTYSYQPQYFNLDESGSEIRVAADFSVNDIIQGTSFIFGMIK